MVNIVFVALGVVVFILSLVVFVRTYRLSSVHVFKPWWVALGILTAFFLAGYVVFGHFLWTGVQIVHVGVVVAQVFFWGAVYVLITAGLFYYTLRAEEKIISQALEKLRQKDEEEKAIVGRLLDQTQAANRELKRVDTAKDEFLSIVTHDLKSPLSSIIGYANLLKEGSWGNLSEKQVSILALVEKQAVSLDEMIGSILDFTRLEFARIKLTREKLNVKEIVSHVVESLQPEAENKSISISLTMSNQDIACNADEKLLSRVIANLVTNSIKYTDAGGSVEVALSESAGRVRISVKDSGRGIAKDNLLRIFDKFYMVENKAEREQRSLGLGLHIAKSFVEAHDGRVWAESDGEGKGSTFYAEIPC